MKNTFAMPNRPYRFEIQECLAQLGVQKGQGLGAEEVASRLAAFGKNSLPSKKKRGLLLVFFSQLYSPLIALLLISAVIIWLIGKPHDAAVVFAVVILNSLMGTLQEGRAARSLDALRKISLPSARVFREGEEKMIDSGEIVPGDIVLLEAGDAIMADMRIIEAARIEVNESVLTGESHTVSKTTEPLIQAETLYEQQNMLFSGTFMVKGRAVGVVTATGVHTELGKMALLAESGKEEKTPIEKKMAQFGHHLMIIALILFCLFFLVGFLRNISLSSIFFVAVSQVVSLIPEGLPVAITIALAVGVQRMAARGALIRRLHAVETLGSTTVICTDKTGTLTKNEMTVTQISICGQPILDIQGVGYDPKGAFLREQKKIEPLSEDSLKQLLEACVLCNDGNVVFQEKTWVPFGDAMEAALITLAKKAGVDVEEFRLRYKRSGEIPFDSSHKMMATRHEGFVLIKGALEEVLALCGSLQESDTRKITEEAKKCASKGKRILGFARVSQNGHLEESFASLQGRGEWLGFVALIDPPRKEALEALSLCRSAHIRTIMLTGDQITTATAIGMDLGIMKEDSIAIDGKELARLPNEEFLKKIGRIAVYARVQPEQKYRIVQALQAQGEVVAMTGDGVNDAPALSKADVGVAMGTGTEVAKEAAKMVITDDNFATLVHAVQQGRLVYRNILKVVFYLLETTFAAAFVMVLAISLGYPLPMAAVQILWINVVTEGTVTINLVLDPPEGDEMDVPPLRRTDPILSRSSLLKLCWIILLIGSVLFGYFLFIQTKEYPLTQLQTEMFTLLAFCAWFTLLSTRSNIRSALTREFLKNRYLTIGLVLSIFLQGLVIYNSTLNAIFYTVPLSLNKVLLLFGIGSIVLWAEEVRKCFLRRNQRKDTKI